VYIPAVNGSLYYLPVAPLRHPANVVTKGMSYKFRYLLSITLLLLQGGHDMYKTQLLLLRSVTFILFVFIFSFLQACSTSQVSQPTKTASPTATSSSTVVDLSVLPKFGTNEGYTTVLQVTRRNSKQTLPTTITLGKFLPKKSLIVTAACYLGGTMMIKSTQLGNFSVACSPTAMPKIIKVSNIAISNANDDISVTLVDGDITQWELQVETSNATSAA
jgi:hypothetical protein